MVHITWYTSHGTHHVVHITWNTSCCINPMEHITWNTSCGIHPMEHITWYISHGTHHVVYITCKTSCGTHHMVHTMWYTSHVRHRVVYITWYTSHGTHHVVHIIWYTSRDDPVHHVVRMCLTGRISLSTSHSLCRDNVGRVSGLGQSSFICGSCKPALPSLQLHYCIQCLVLHTVMAALMVRWLMEFKCLTSDLGMSMEMRDGLMVLVVFTQQLYQDRTVGDQTENGLPNLGQSCHQSVPTCVQAWQCVYSQH